MAGKASKASGHMKLVPPRDPFAMPEQAQAEVLGLVGAAQQETVGKGLKAYLAKAPDRYLACRERRHDFPMVPIEQMQFVRDATGYDVWDQDCARCGAAFRREWWIIVCDPDGTIRRMQMVDRKTQYHRPEELEDGAYLLPAGSGSVAPNAIYQMRVYSGMVGKVLPGRAVAAG